MHDPAGRASTAAAYVESLVTLSNELPLVTISVVSHGDAPVLERLLVSLRAREQTSRLELIVTDNLGHDLPALDQTGWQRLIVLRNARPLGYARNHNQAFGKSASSYFCVVNPDVIFVEGVFERLIAAMAEQSADLAAPVIVNSDGRVQDSFRKLPNPWELVRRRLVGASLAMPPSGPIHPDWIAGTFLLARRHTFAQLGGFDARYHLYFEDVDLCTRARLGGYGILVDPRVRLQHDPRRSSRSDPRYLLWHLQSAVRFFASPTYRQARRMRDDRHGT